VVSAAFGAAHGRKAQGMPNLAAERSSGRPPSKRIEPQARTSQATAAQVVARPSRPGKKGVVMRTMIVVGLLLCASVASAGCCCGHPCAQGVFYCDPCDTCCGPACDPCGPCGDCCGQHCCLLEPVRWVFGVLGFHCCGVCNGCGPTYCGDWCDSPPDCCDPCDQCGNYIGQQSPYVRSGPYVNQAYAGRPRAVAPVANHQPTTSRSVASVPRRMTATQVPARVKSQPRIIAETDVVVEQPVNPAAWQTGMPHLAPARR